MSQVLRPALRATPLNIVRMDPIFNQDNTLRRLRPQEHLMNLLTRPNLYRSSQRQCFHRLNSSSSSSRNDQLWPQVLGRQEL